MTDVLVLCYHAVSRSWPADLAVDPDQLRSQLEAVQARGYRAMTFTEAVTQPVGRRAVAVTFDDAYRSIVEGAFPILEELGIPGTLFVPTDHVGTDRPMSWPGIDGWMAGDHEKELLPMTWEEVEQVSRAGWEIGSHSCSHPHLTMVDDTTLERELVESRQRCEERLQRPCMSLAYPYGDADERVVRAARGAGYSTACLLPARFSAPAPLEWPRVGIYRGDSLSAFRAKISPAVRRLRGSPVWAGLDAVRGMVIRRMRLRS